jgi:hypothetical protein
MILNFILNTTITIRITLIAGIGNFTIIIRNSSAISVGSRYVMLSCSVLSLQLVIFLQYERKDLLYQCIKDQRHRRNMNRTGLMHFYVLFTNFLRRLYSQEFNIGLKHFQIKKLLFCVSGVLILHLMCIR